MKGWIIIELLYEKPLVYLYELDPQLQGPSPDDINTLVTDIKEEEEKTSRTCQKHL